MDSSQVVEVVILIGILLSACAIKSAETVSSFPDFYLPPDYATARPPSQPVKVMLNMGISEIINVNDKKNELQLEGELNLMWEDQRILFNETRRSPGTFDENAQVILDLNWRDKIWTPDLWIESLRRFVVNKAIDDQATLTLSRNKTFELWQSVSIKTSCPMDFDAYPFDAQACRLRFSANGLDISMQTFSGSIYLQPSVHFSQGALQYTQISVHQDKNLSFTSTISRREWPQVHACFYLTRRKLDHILQTFQPTGCLVCLSWISFLIPPYIVPGRMVLLVTLLLVVFGTYQSEHQRSPRSSTLNALDIWFVGCMVFVLGAVGEYAILLFLKKVIIKKRRRQEEEEESRALEERVKIQSLTSPTSAKEIDPKPHGVDDLSSSKVSTIGCTFGQSLVRIQKVPLSAGLVTTRYRVSPLSSSRHREIIRVSPAAAGGQMTDAAMDSGSDYGDVNETDLAGEESLERIDEYALKTFPVAFFLFNIGYWINYLIFRTQREFECLK